MAEAMALEGEAGPLAIEYNEKVLEHFLNPHNVGWIEDPDGVGQVGDASCGDVFHMFIRVHDNRLADIKYLVQGCGSAIATCSALSDIAAGMTLDEALKLNDDDIAAALGGLPLEKLHCSNFAATALHRAIEDYRKRHKGRSDWRTPYSERRRREGPSGESPGR